MFSKKLNYKLEKGIFDFNLKDTTVLKVGKFYEEDPFPDYKIDDNKLTIQKRGDNNLLMRELKKFVGYDKSILEIGSGTSQLSNYLAIGTNNRICAFDSSLNSLKLGKEFAEKNNIENINFVRGDIFDKIFEDEIFDFIWCSGVLHHTKNPSEAFKCILQPLKKDGYIFLGLYNKFGRFRTMFRRYVYKIFGKKIVTKLDPVLRKIPNENQSKINAWIKDQYLHPVESTHTFDEILKWFEINNIEFINSIPEITPFCDEKNIFEKNLKGTFIERILQQIIMIFSKAGGEGGLFIFVGKKNS